MTARIESFATWRRNACGALTCVAPRSLRCLILGVAATLVAAGCPRDKVRGTPAPKVCASSRDCDDGWVCLSGQCADTRKSAAFTHPEQQVTPDKVRREVEQQQEQHMRRIDDQMKDPDLTNH